MFGKVHHAFSAGAHTVKAGLGRLNHTISNAYAMGHKAHGIYNTSKQLASLFMPAMQRLSPDLAKDVVGGFGKLDALRDRAVETHGDVLNKIKEQGDLVAAARAAKPLLQPYM